MVTLREARLHVLCVALAATLRPCHADLTEVAMRDSERLKLEPQHQLAEAWSSVVPEFPSENIHVLPSIAHAIGVIRDLETGGSDVQVLVAGSLHLVGGVIEVAGLNNVALSSGTR